MQDALNARALMATYALHEEGEDPLEDMDPIALLSNVNKDTMYFNQAIKQPDAPQFINTMVQEINDHVSRDHWDLIPRSQVPKDQQVLPSV